MKVKRSKCEFHQSETEYLGFIIGQEGVKRDPVKTQAIWDWTTRKTIKEIQYFLGFGNFYRRFIEGFQQDGQTTICKNKKGIHWQLGMGRQRTARIRRTKDKTRHGSSTGIL